MRVVIAVDGSTGDVHPMLLLAATLLRDQHDVLLCAPPDFEADAQNRGVPFVACGTQVRAYLRRSAARMGSGLALIREARRYIDQATQAQFALLPAVARGADLIVAAGLQFGARSVADLHGARYQFIAYTPVLFPSREHPAIFVARQTLPGWMNQLTWRALEWMLRRDGSRIAQLRAQLGQGPVDNPFDYLLGDRPVLAADHGLAPPPSDLSREILQVAALVGANREPLGADVEAFLAQGSPPVYFGFGSMTDPNPEKTTRLVLDAVAQIGCRAIVSAGWAELGTGTLPSHVLRVGTVSHVHLFPRVSLVVHHGGAGTTTTAFRAGVPQLVVPHVLDQNYFAHRIFRLGLGPRPIAKSKLSVRSLVDGVKAVLENDSFRASAVAHAAAPVDSVEETARRILQQ